MEWKGEITRTLRVVNALLFVRVGEAEPPTSNMATSRTSITNRVRRRLLVKLKRGSRVTPTVRYLVAPYLARLTIDPAPHPSTTAPAVKTPCPSPFHKYFTFPHILTLVPWYQMTISRYKMSSRLLLSRRPATTGPRRRHPHIQARHRSSAWPFKSSADGWISAREKAPDSAEVFLHFQRTLPLRRDSLANTDCGQWREKMPSALGLIKFLASDWIWDRRCLPEEGRFQHHEALHTPKNPKANATPSTYEITSFQQKPSSIYRVRIKRTGWRTRDERDGIDRISFRNPREMRRH